MNNASEFEVLRFWSKVEFGIHWKWTGANNHRGYGRFRLSNSRRRVQAHRWAWEYFNKSIPNKLVIDHLCKVPSCVNPTHLDVVPQGENIRRGDSPAGVNSRKTHCPENHPLVGENLVWIKGKGNSLSRRRCRVCNLNATKRYQRRKKLLTFQ